MSHPYLRVLMFAIRNILRGWRSPVWRARLLWTGGVVILATLIMTTLLRRPTPLLERAIRHVPVIYALMALQCSLVVHLSRWRRAEIHSSDWLSSLPLSARQTRLRLAVRVFADVLPLPLLAILLAWTLRPADALQRAELSRFVLGIAGAAAAGAILGWWLPRRAPSAQRARLRPSAARILPGGALAPLSDWPRSVLRTWLPPRGVARLIIPAALLLPMGVSANFAVPALVLWALGWHLLLLLRAILVALREGSQWLLPTPISFPRLAWALTRKALLSEVLWTGAAAILLVALGCSAQLAVRLAELWLSSVSIIVAIELTRSGDRVAARLRTAAALCLLFVLDRLRDHLAPAFSAVGCIALLRKRVRT